MKKVLSFFIYFFIVILVLMIPLSFMANGYFAKKLTRISLMRINPLLSGGEILRQIRDDNMNIFIYSPVYKALIGGTSKGFVQVRFSVAKNLPDLINRNIDYNNDGKNDFRVYVNTKTGATNIEPLDSQVTGLNASSKYRHDWVIRVNINKATNY